MRFLDLLAQRYASPFFVLDDFIRLGQIYDFFEDIVKTIADEREEKYRWEYYLHKVFDKSFDEFTRGMTTPKDDDMTKDDIQSIVAQSARIAKSSAHMKKG